MKSYKELFTSVMLNEYKAPYAGINTLQDLIDAVEGLFPGVVKIKQTPDGISVDGRRFKAVDDYASTSKKIGFDDKIEEALRANKKLMKVWKEVHGNYSLVLKELKKYDVRRARDIDWATYGPRDMRSFIESINNMVDLLEKLPFNLDKVMREYEVLRVLFDRGYESLRK